MGKGLWSAGILVLLLNSTTYAASPIVRMGWRPAPPDSTAPRISPQFVKDIEALPVALVLELPAPTDAERTSQKLLALRPEKAIGFGRVPAANGAMAQVRLSADTSAMRLRVRSNGAAALRIGLLFSDSADYDLVAYVPGDPAAAIPVTRSGSQTPSMQVFWSPVTNGDTQEVTVRRTLATANAWSVSISVVSHIDSPILPDSLNVVPNTAAFCQHDVACLYATARECRGVHEISAHEHGETIRSLEVFQWSVARK